MAQPLKRSKMISFRAFLAAEAGGTGIEFTIVAAGVGLAISVPIYLVGGMLTEKFEMIASALKRQNN
jgi:Flp pilus assembly pilin Flp